MNTRLLILISILFLGISSLTFAQDGTALPFLQYPVSPSLNGMGATGTSLPTDDPFGFLYNPAQLGFTGRESNLSFSIYPSSVDFFPGISAEVNAYALNLGYNFEDLIHFPLTVGFGFARPELSFGQYNVESGNGTYEPGDYYHTYSIGAGIDYCVQFSAGLTYKNVTSIISSLPNSTGKVDLFDFGFLLNVPVVSIIDKNPSVQFLRNVPATPFLNLSFGYSQLNIGDEIYYFDPQQADPVPRTARLGYGLSTGVDLKIKDNSVRALSFNFTVDAADILVKRDTLGSTSYQSGFGDISIGDNIINIKGDANVLNHSGVKIDLVETISFLWGKYSGRYFKGIMQTSGYEIRAKGLFKLIETLEPDPAVKFISDHFDIRYYNSTYNKNTTAENKFSGIAVFMEGFTL
ncbi:MAG: hypothetical protein P8Y81_13020 [Ignavibacteriaceae bacterium]